MKGNPRGELGSSYQFPKISVVCIFGDPSVERRGGVVQDHGSSNVPIFPFKSFEHVRTVGGYIRCNTDRTFAVVVSQHGFTLIVASKYGTVEEKVDDFVRKEDRFMIRKSNVS